MTSIFDKIPMREKDLSKRAIYLMRACVVLYLASAAGLFLLQVDDMAHSTFGKYIYFALALAILGTAVCFCTNRLWWRIGFPDKYLDEWEIQLRSDIRGFGYRLACVISVVALIFVASFTGNENAIELSSDALYNIVIVNALLILFLPMAYMAWRIKPLP